VTFTIANIITLARLFIAPIFLVFALTDTAWAINVAAILFIVGAVSDYFDGLLARKYGEVTELGVYLDPLADKVLTTAAFVVFFVHDIMPLWMVIIIIIRDFGTTALRSLASAEGRPLVTSRSAKVKTFLQMAFIAYALVLMWARHMLGEPAASDAYRLLYSTPTYLAILGITLFTLWTAIEYVIDNRSMFHRES